MSMWQRDLALGAGLAAIGVNQIVFQPDGLGGVHLVATSLVGAETVDGWTRALEPYLRRLAAPSGSWSPGLTYLQFAPELAAVLCRRAHGGDAPQRRARVRRAARPGPRLATAGARAPARHRRLPRGRSRRAALGTHPDRRAPVRAADLDVHHLGRSPGGRR